jgi:hypothetical protein
MADGGGNSFPWARLFVSLQVGLLVALLNPWSNVLRKAAFVIAGVDVLFIILFLIPVLLYQLLVKRSSWRDSFRKAVQVFFMFFTGGGAL